MDASSAAVIAHCESASEGEDGFRVCRMRITEVVKGDPKLADSVVEMASIEDLPPSEPFWLVGYGDTALEWVSPKQISTKSVSYLRGLSSLPERGHSDWSTSCVFSSMPMNLSPPMPTTSSRRLPWRTSRH